MAQMGKKLGLFCWGGHGTSNPYRDKFASLSILDFMKWNFLD